MRMVIRRTPDNSPVSAGDSNKQLHKEKQVRGDYWLCVGFCSFSSSSLLYSLTHSLTHSLAYSVVAQVQQSYINMGHKKDPDISFFTAFLTYLSYVMLIIVGHLRDFFASLTGITRYEGVRTKKGYSVLLKSWESFFTRRLYHRVQDCWNRPICSNPGSYFDVMERASEDENCTLHTTGKILRCLNLGSYNYLGFGDNWAESCADDVIDTLHKEPIASTSSRMDFGTNASIVELENAVASFMGKEAAIVLTMGYGTNFSTIPALLGKNSLIISDSLNHTSLVNGSRSSSAQIRVFNHNDPAHLEQVLRESIIQGQPRHHRPWAKIVVMVEGIYSMEGAICKLPEIVAICKKYKAYVYVDEAHSVGALGKTGRGICEYHGVDTKDVDVLMVSEVYMVPLPMFLLIS
jgi:serine palmitoyltransferase